MNINYEHATDEQLFEGLTIQEIVECVKQMISDYQKEAKRFPYYSDTFASWMEQAKKAKKSLKFYKAQI